MLTIDGKTYQILSIRRVGQRGFSVTAQLVSDNPTWETDPAYRKLIFISRDQQQVKK